jgi:hypothetical protein
MLTGFSNAELLAMTVMDATPLPRTEEGRRFWQEFIVHAVQRGGYELQRKDGPTVRVRHWAYASVGTWGPRVVVRSGRGPSRSRELTRGAIIVPSRRRCGPLRPRPPVLH